MPVDRIARQLAVGDCFLPPSSARVYRSLVQWRRRCKVVPQPLPSMAVLPVGKLGAVGPKDPYAFLLQR